MAATLGSPVPHLYGVYAIRNQVTGAMYVGSTSDLRTRWSGHLAALRQGLASRSLQKAWRDSGGEKAFQLVMLEAIPRVDLESDGREALRQAEMQLAEQGVELYNHAAPLPQARAAVIGWAGDLLNVQIRGVPTSLCQEIRIESIRKRVPLNRLLQDLWDAYQQVHAEATTAA